MKLKILLSAFIFSFSVAHAQQSPPEDCNPTADGCDVGGCSGWYDDPTHSPKPAAIYCCNDTPKPSQCGTTSAATSTATTTAVAGPSGIPNGTEPGRSSGNPAPLSAMDTHFSDSCPLNVKDSYADEVRAVLAQIQVACPQIGANNTSIIDNYIGGYVNQSMNLPQGITCDNRNTVLPAQITQAKSFGTVLAAQPNNAFSQCWIYNYDPNTYATTYVEDPTCFERVVSSVNETCTTERNKNYQDSSVANALQGIDKELTSSKDPKCRDIAPQVIGLVGQLVGTTPLGLAGVSAFQLFAGTFDKWLNHKRAAEQDELKKFLKGTTDSLRQTNNACHYYNFVQGVLECPRFSPSAKAENACSEQQFTELKPAVDALGQLHDKLNAILGDVKGTTVDLSDKKANVADKANSDLSPAFFDGLNSLLKTPITFPDSSGTKGPLSDYLKKLAVPNDADNTATAVARSQLKDLLDEIPHAKSLYLAKQSGQLKQQFLSTLLYLGSDPGGSSVTPFNLDILTQSATGLKAVAAHDQNAKLKSDSDNLLNKVAEKNVDANPDLNSFLASKQNADDVKAFIASKVDQYTNYKKGGQDDPRVLALLENRAVQACADLAPSFYYMGTKTPNVPYENTPNPNFNTEFKSACGDLFKDAPALANLTLKPNPAPAPATPGNIFKQNVCAAENAKVSPEATTSKAQ